MSIKVFQTNKTGKIEFTRCELEKLLNETYKEGYSDGETHIKKDYLTWTAPTIPNTGYNYRDLNNPTSNAANIPNEVNCTQIKDEIKNAITPKQEELKEKTFEIQLPENFDVNSFTKAIQDIFFNPSEAFENSNVFSNLAKELRGV